MAGPPARICDVIIVGGGTVGCSAALHLALRGLDVVLLERGLVGEKASGLNFGGVRQQQRKLPELPLARRARDMWDRFPQMLGSDCGFRPTGHLQMALSEDELAKLTAYAAAAGEHGLDLEMLSAAELRRRHPWAGPEVVGGSWSPTDGQADPTTVTPAFAAAARQAGATIHEGAPARHISHDGDEFQVTACTAAGDSLTFLSSHLINAAGAWANEIARQFGEPAPMAPRAPQMAESEPLPALISPVLGCVSGAVYLRQAADGRIFFGGGYGRLLDDGENAEPVEQTSRATLAAALRLAPALKDMKVRRAWSGVEGYMEDGVQVLGPSATTDGLLHGFGFSGHGFQIGPAAGAVLADLVLSGRSTTPIDAFAITRFAAAS